MKLEAEQVLCRFHLSNFVHHHGEPLYQWIVETARHEGVQGATVLKGVMGLRPDGSIRRSTLGARQGIARDCRVVDGPRRIEALLARVEPVFSEGEITLERAHVVLYRGDARRPAGARSRLTSSRPRPTAPRGRSRQ